MAAVMEVICVLETTHITKDILEVSYLTCLLLVSLEKSDW